MAYRRAVAALDALQPLGALVTDQLDGLRRTLDRRTGDCRRSIYQGAFSGAHEYAGAEVGADGSLGIMVAAGGVSAPAQHVANASALRAGLLAFFLCF
jgi:hypothetical protein